MIENMIQIRAVEEEDMSALQEMAKADDHAVIAPSLIVEKDGQIIGYLGMVPTVLVWLDSQRVKARDSLIVANTYENLLRAQWNGVIAVPCVNKSPLKEYLPKLGYFGATDVTLFLKNLNPRRV